MTKELEEYSCLVAEVLAMDLENEKAYRLAESKLLNFFHDKVVIPKGKNRHKYADVLHEWIEGEIIECNVDTWRQLGTAKQIFTDKEYQIKPSKPVYEWQWTYIQDDYTFKTENFYTDDEARKDFIKIKETKRERKQ